MTRLYRISIRLTLWLALAGMVALGVAIALTVVDVVLRKVSNTTVSGMVDIVQLCVMVAAMLSIPYVFLVDQHVSIDLFTQHMPGVLQRVLRVFSAVLGMVLLLAIFRFSLAQALLEHSYGDRSQTIGIPMLWYWVPLLAGMAVAVLANLLIILRFILVPGLAMVPGEEEG